jgi:hypothetical protein
MYLPVILVREMGVWGWVIFVIPNILGAAAMPWVLSTPMHSAVTLARHTGACVAFSTLTVAFHLFFVVWMLPTGALILFVVLTVLMLWAGARRDLTAGVLALAVSLAALIVMLVVARVDHVSLSPAGATSIPKLLSLAPICAFGFLLCPYLDVTFHRARIATSAGAGRAAFALGFGVFFLLMMVFTLLYSRVIAAPGLPTALASAIAVHMAVQSAFTVGLHVRMHRWTAVFGLVLAAVVFVLTGLGLRVLPHGDFAVGEATYRVFMGFYALVFPAYVWLCMIPTRDARPEPSLAKMRVLLLSVVLAGPLFWMGFMTDKTFFLLPGVGLVLVGRLAVSGLFAPRKPGG